jgi:hypothetical protein
MARRYKVDEIHLEITNVIPFVNDRKEGFIIQWCSDIGYGEYTIFKTAGTDMWVADSETMDRNEDKDFIKELMKLFIEQLQIL